MEIETRSIIEALETRIAPAIVTVDFTGGVLTLNSDNGNHDFIIEALDANTFELRNGTGTEFQVGTQDPTLRLRLTGSLKAFDVTLGDGNDRFEIVGLNVAGDVSIDVGAGSNHVEVESLTAKGSLEYVGRSGGDELTFGTGPVIVKKNVSINLGDGSNFVRFEAAIAQIGGELSYIGGSDDELIEINTGKLAIGKSARFTFGAGHATFQMEEPTMSVGKDFIFDSSDSIAGDQSVLSLRSKINVHGSLIYRDGAAESTIIAELSTNGPVVNKVEIITGGGGYDLQAFALNAQIFSFDASASTGGSFDLISFGSTKAKSVRITGSAGNDDIEFSESFSKMLSLSADFGDGDNEVDLDLFDTLVKDIRITCEDGLNVFDGSLTGTRVLGSVDLRFGGGSATTDLEISDSKIFGPLRFSVDANSSSGQLFIEANDSQLGGIDFTGPAASSKLDITGIQDFAIKGPVKVSTAGGNDTVEISSQGPLKIAKGISLELGDGTNNVTLSGLLQAKSLSVTGGADDDGVLIGGGGNIGSVNLDLREGTNSAVFGGQPGSFLAMKAVTLTSTSSGTDTDFLSIARVQILGKFDAQFGAGLTSVQIDDSIVNAPFTVDTGAGADSVNLDITSAGPGLIFTKAVSINLGLGNDTLVIGGNDPGQFVTAKAKFKADGGIGTNTLTNSPNNIFAKGAQFPGFL